MRLRLKHDGGIFKVFSLYKRIIDKQKQQILIIPSILPFGKCTFQISLYNSRIDTHIIEQRFEFHYLNIYN